MFAGITKFCPIILQICENYASATHKNMSSHRLKKSFIVVVFVCFAFKNNKKSRTVVYPALIKSYLNRSRN